MKKITIGLLGLVVGLGLVLIHKSKPNNHEAAFSLRQTSNTYQFQAIKIAFNRS